MKQLEKSVLKKGTEIGKLEDDLTHANTEISSLAALGDQFASLKSEQIEITEENEKMKKELLEWQKVLESEHQQQKRCWRCKSADRRRFGVHSSGEQRNIKAITLLIFVKDHFFNSKSK